MAGQGSAGLHLPRTHAQDDAAAAQAEADAAAARLLRTLRLPHTEAAQIVHVAQALVQPPTPEGAAPAAGVAVPGSMPASFCHMGPWGVGQWVCGHMHRPRSQREAGLMGRGAWRLPMRALSSHAWH